ncbi:MAG TPA: hypothetical protein VMH33_01365 [Solirubrobacterales bacterium]|nr:hypothetical protein [Solirubrobacterales bacterium]
MGNTREAGRGVLSAEPDIYLPHIAAVVYANEILAGRALEEIDRCATDSGVDRDAFATVVCERDGTYRLTTTRPPQAAAHWTRFWGRLFEAVADRESMEGLDPAFRDRLEAALWPGTSALLMAIDPALRSPLLGAVSPFGGDLLALDGVGVPRQETRRTGGGDQEPFSTDSAGA